MTLYSRLVRLKIHHLDLFALIKHTCYEVRVVSSCGAVTSAKSVIFFASKIKRKPKNIIAVLNIFKFCDAEFILCRVFYTSKSLQRKMSPQVFR